MSEEKPTPPAPERKLLNLDAPPIVTEHRIGDFEYTATVGMMPIFDENGEPKAGMFYIAYTKKDAEPGTRPLMFSFNGGPGSSSVWLHLGAVGPKRVKMLPDGGLPDSPYELVDNPETWLQDTDLVFIDPIGTGYSRAIKPEDDEKYWSLKGDIDSVGAFIRLYLSRYQRWSSPLYLVGESYGTTRAAGLAGHLIDYGVAFKGIVLVSSVLSFQTLDFTIGNDLPYIYFLPTYAATAAFHGRAKAGKDVRGWLKEVERWASTEYTVALGLGDALSESDRKKVIEKLGEYTGLSAEFIDNTDLRINIHEFCKELMRDKKVTVGRLDSRFTGVDFQITSNVPEKDPSMTAIRAPYTATINDYLSRTLGYITDETYRVLGEGGLNLWKRWDWGSARDGHPDTSQPLWQALSKNPHMRVFVASGFYDLATPYFATYYTLDHMRLGPMRKNFVCHEYAAGHMMYIDEKELLKLKQDVTAFLKGKS